MQATTRRRRRRRALCALLSVTALLATACASGTVTDKTGTDVLTLRFATIDKINPNGQTFGPAAFLRELYRVSGGQVKVTVLAPYGSGAAAAESDLVRSIASGSIDVGTPATRAFFSAGLPGLQPSEAPFLITNYAAEKAVVSGPAGQAMLQTLDGTGIVGLGLLAGPLRRPFSTKAPLLSLRDWQGTTVRTFNSVTQAAAIRALGGVPVSASWLFPNLVKSGKLQAVELDVPQYAHSNYGDLMPFATRNVVLWPKISVIAINRDLFDSLSDPHKEWLRQAAAAATRASVAYPLDDTPPADQLCEQGVVRFLDASPAEVAALQTAVQPVYDQLARDKQTAPLLRLVQRAAAAHPGVEAPTVPPRCRRTE